jgi:hypothetical protein
MKLVTVICATLALFCANSYAAKPEPKRLCDSFPHLQQYAAETAQDGKGCTWNFSENNHLDAFVAEGEKQDVIKYSKMAMDKHEQIMRDGQYPFVSRKEIFLCMGGEVLIGDLGNGTGKGGAAYLISNKYVYGFSFQGDKSIQLFFDLLPKACSMKYKGS